MTAKKLIGFAFCCLLLLYEAIAQPESVALSYPFLCNECNTFICNSQASKEYALLFQKFNELILKGQGVVHIMQIGDSHIQADHFSGQMRHRIRQFMPGIAGSRGFVFPYRAAKTNNPDNYRVESEGNWSSCRNIQQVNCDMGISGITITTFDPNSKIRIQLKNSENDFFDFNIVKVFHSFGDTSFVPDIQPENVVSEVKRFPKSGYTEFHLNQYAEEITIGFKALKESHKSVSVYGLSFENEDPGVIYSSLGVNGAEVISFLKCNLIQQQLQVLSPDWIILSLGTNDAFGKGFVPGDFKRNYGLLIDRIRGALPNVPILLTTPPDSYRKKVNNPNMVIAGQAIKELAEEKNCAVWDLYLVMGGKGSMLKWLKSGLAAYDRVHFSVQGYRLQGNLLFDAFFNTYDKYIDSK